ncbi:MAG: hypothetical protein AWU54_1250 [Candidatus Frackibacter sp. T328-2]|jgi:hypothetical protein|nr:MAG: hypothetical protein AWU54_1250 [Candidatus Frackibacter sp. T328-2]
MIKVKTFVDSVDDKLEKELNKIGEENIKDILFTVDSWEDGAEEIVKVIYIQDDEESIKDYLKRMYSFTEDIIRILHNPENIDKEYIDDVWMDVQDIRGKMREIKRIMGDDL